MAKDIDLRNMTRTDMEDEVMLLRAKCWVQDNEIYSLREQLAALRGELASLTCACCDPPCADDRDNPGPWNGLERQ